MLVDTGNRLKKLPKKVLLLVRTLAYLWTRLCLYFKSKFKTKFMILRSELDFAESLGKSLILVRKMS